MDSFYSSLAMAEFQAHSPSYMPVKQNTPPSPHYLSLDISTYLGDVIMILVLLVELGDARKEFCQLSIQLRGGEKIHHIPYSLRHCQSQLQTHIFTHG